MPKVQIVVPISGARDGQDWPAPGGFVDVPEAEAADLIRAGLARAIVKAEPEKAVARKKPETRGGGLRKDSLG